MQAELAKVNDTWRALHGQVDEYRKQLHAAREVRSFTDNISARRSWVKPIINIANYLCSPLGAYDKFLKNYGPPVN